MAFNFVKDRPETVFDNNFLLIDRLQKIRQIINKYGEENFVVSYSGGKDSNVLSFLIDKALPDNQIPRVYADTGIELKAVRDFVKQKCEEDSRFEIIKPTVPIKKMLESEGYPFKSKRHSDFVAQYQRHNGNLEEKGISSVQNYIGQSDKQWSVRKLCPKVLLYQFTSEFTLKVSSKCCVRLKKDPFHKWQRERAKPYSIIGIMPDESGQRESAQCLAFKPNGELKAFQPLVPVTKEWEDWLIQTYDIKLPIVYYPPYNLSRTGCCGCPFNVAVEKQLAMLKENFPSDYKVACAVWKPVYDEYRRIGYRLKENTNENH